MRATTPSPITMRSPGAGAAGANAKVNADSGGGDYGDLGTPLKSEIFKRFAHEAQASGAGFSRHEGVAHASGGAAGADFDFDARDALSRERDIVGYHEFGGFERGRDGHVDDVL